MSRTRWSRGPRRAGTTYRSDRGRSSLWRRGTRNARSREEQAMKLFIDSAELADIETIAGWGVLSGVTTNPTLLGKVEGDPDDIYRRVCELVDGPVSAEVVAEARGDMV